MYPGEDLLHRRTLLAEEPPMQVSGNAVVETILEQVPADVRATALVTEQITQRGHGRAQLRAIEVAGIHARSEDEHQTRLPVGQPKGGSEQIGGDLDLRTRPYPRNGCHHPGPAILRTTTRPVNVHCSGGQGIGIARLEQGRQVPGETITITTKRIEAGPTLAPGGPYAHLPICRKHRPT